MAEMSWPAFEITQEHMQNLVSQGYMTAAKLATCRVSADPISPTPVAEHVVACAAFYERGIWCSFTSIPLLAAAVLWIGAASFESVEDPAYSILRDPARVLHGG
jgi:hypothetical protein